MLFKKIILVICIFFINFGAESNEKIAFINIEYLFENSNIGKTVINNLKENKSKNLELIKIKETELINEENEIKKTQNIISKDELSKKISSFRKNVEIYNKEKDEIFKKFKKIENDELNIFFKKINPILQDYMNKESIDLLFEKKNIFIGRSTSDITQAILKIINIELK